MKIDPPPPSSLTRFRLEAAKLGSSQGRPERRQAEVTSEYLASSLKCFSPLSCSWRDLLSPVDGYLSPLVLSARRKNIELYVLEIQELYLNCSLIVSHPSARLRRCRFLLLRCPPLAGRGRCPASGCTAPPARKAPTAGRRGAPDRGRKTA